MNLLNVFHHKVFSVSFVINEKKTTVMKSLSIYFGHHSLAFLNSFLNILNKYNALIFNKYNLGFIHEFVLAIFWGLRTEDRRIQTPIFNIFYCFWMFANKLFTYLTCAYLKKLRRCFNVKSSTYYFHMKTKILLDFQICISVPLRWLVGFEWLIKISNFFQFF